MEKRTINPLLSSQGRRFFLATAFLLIVTVVSAVVVTLLIGSKIADEAVSKALERGQLVQESFEEARLERLSLIAEIFAADPVFTSYLIEALETGDPLSILDQLNDRRDGLQFDFAMVVDPEGQLVARTDSVIRGEEDLSEEPLIAKALEDYEASGVWNKDGELFDAIVVPLGAGDVLYGFMVVSYAIDDEIALRLRRISDTEVTVLSRDGTITISATTLDEQLERDLLTRVQTDASLLDSGPTERRELELGGRRWLALNRTLSGPNDEPVGAVVSLASLEEPLAPFQRIYKTLALVGLASILAALVLTFFIVQREMGPLARLVEVANRAADGDYDQRIEVEREDEIGRLAKAFNVLLSELREKRDMEVYVNELSRNMPQPETTMVTRTLESAPARERLATLLGVELRGYASGDPGGFHNTAGAALERLSADLRSIANVVASHSGKIESLVGHRLVASFDGDRRAEQGLTSASEILAYVNRQQGGSYDGVVVLIDGPIVSGSILWGEGEQNGLTGEAVEELENLLRVAQPGHLLLASSAFEAVRPRLNEAGIQLQPQRSSVTANLLYNVPVGQTTLFAAPETSATQVMTQSGTLPKTGGTLSGIGPGSLLGNRFEILSVLGSGGMGIVYKARDLTLGELVALKMLKDFVVDEEAQLGRLKDELRLARKIGHPNVLRTYDFGELDGVPFISMEYVLGITLRQLLDQSGRLPLSAGLRLAKQLCRGLEAAHDESVLHRDIKPENLIVEHTGNVKLMDFGIARPITRSQVGQTSPEAIVGTPFYLAPEQLAGEEPDERADLYACGVVFYEIFTGKLPFKVAGNIMQIITQRLKNEPPIPPKELWPGIPDPLESILLRCLEFEREARFPNTTALLDDLEALRA